MTNTDILRSRSLTYTEHEDMSKHYIGEALPVPALSDMKPSGVAYSTGVSPIPSRSDHTHDNQTIYTAVNSGTSKTCPGSGAKTYINGLQYLSLGRNLFAPVSSQLLVVPTSSSVSLWFSQINITVQRSAGLFTSYFQFLIEYNNAASPRTLGLSLLPAGIGFYLFTATDFFVMNPNDNAQLSYVNNDSVDHIVSINSWVFTRSISEVSQ